MVTVLLKPKTNFWGNGAYYFVMNSVFSVFPCCLFPFCPYSLNPSLYTYIVSTSSLLALLALLEAQAAFLILEPLKSGDALGSSSPTIWAVSLMLLQQNIWDRGDISLFPFLPRTGTPRFQEHWVAKHPFAVHSTFRRRSCKCMLITDEIFGEFKKQTHLSWA